MSFYSLKYTKQQWKKANYRVLVLIFVFIGFIITGCNEGNRQHTTVKGNEPGNSSEDKAYIIQLIKKMYKWQETDSSKNNMVCLAGAGDSVYIGINLEKQRLRSEELRCTGFFSKEFINNDYKIAETIDSMLRKGAYGDPWIVGDLPPFGSDANAWCNCQDVPTDTAWWNAIKFKFITLDSDKATLTWAWVDTVFDKSRSEYTVKVTKTNGAWKVAYLQGFDFGKFVAKNY